MQQFWDETSPLSSSQACYPIVHSIRAVVDILSVLGNVLPLYQVFCVFEAQPDPTVFLISKTSNSQIFCFSWNKLENIPENVQGKPKTAACLFFLYKYIIFLAGVISNICNCIRDFFFTVPFCFAPAVYYNLVFVTLQSIAMEMNIIPQLTLTSLDPCSLEKFIMKYQLLCLGHFYRRILGKERLKMYTALDSFSNMTEAQNALGQKGLPSCAGLTWPATECPPATCSAPSCPQEDGGESKT